MDGRSACTDKRHANDSTQLHHAGLGGQAAAVLVDAALGDGDCNPRRRSTRASQRLGFGTKPIAATRSSKPMTPVTSAGNATRIVAGRAARGGPEPQ